MNLHDFWMLAPDEQETIRQDHPEYSEQDHQAFLNALFPAYKSFEDAETVYDLSDTHDHAFCW